MYNNSTTVQTDIWNYFSLCISPINVAKSLLNRDDNLKKIFLLKLECIRICSSIILSSFRMEYIKYLSWMCFWLREIDIWENITFTMKTFWTTHDLYKQNKIQIIIGSLRKYLKLKLINSNVEQNHSLKIT